MSIPDFQTLMRPVLAHLDDGSTRRSRDIKDTMANQFEPSDTERADVLPSGRQRTIDNRVGWALTYLSQAGRVAPPKSLKTVITTDEGRAALGANPSRFDMRPLDA